MEQVGGGTLPFFMALAEGFFNLPLPENYYINIYLLHATALIPHECHTLAADFVIICNGQAR